MKKSENLFYILIHSLLKCINKISTETSIKISHVLGNIVYSIDGRHRKVALDNLFHAYGSTMKGPTRIHVAKKVYRNLCQSIFEISWLAEKNTKNLKHRIKIKGSKNLDINLSKKKGVLLISGHIGAWELLPYAISEIGTVVNIVYRPLDSEPLNKIISELRTMFGANLIPTTKCALPKISHALKRNEAVGLLIDQSSDWYNGVWVDFFGHRTCTSKGVARIALKSGAPVVPVFIFRRDNNFEIYFHEAIPLVNTGDMTKDIETNTENYSKIIEREVRRHPEQWFWVHRRWKNKAYSPLPRIST